LREPVSVRNAASVIVATTLVIVVVGGVSIRALDRDEYSRSITATPTSLPTAFVGVTSP
jgi:hypothetical protein